LTGKVKFKDGEKTWTISRHRWRSGRRRPMPGEWSDEELAQLRDSWEGARLSHHTSAEAIGALSVSLKRSYQAVLAKLQYLGLPQTVFLVKLEKHGEYRVVRVLVKTGHFEAKRAAEKRCGKGWESVRSMREGGKCSQSVGEERRRLLSR
jgi:hypothetical protein